MWRWSVIALVVALAACGSGAPGTTGRNPSAATPLEALPECGEPPPAGAEAPPGFVAPEGTIIENVAPQDPLTSVTGYVAMTPGGVRLTYESMRDIDVLTSEDEIFESELLVSDGEYRTYVKATAACRDGSYLLAVVAPEGEAGVLPTPAGRPPTFPPPPPQAP